MSSPRKLKVWIVNYYTGTPENVSNPRYLEFADYFMQAGYDVTTFNSSKASKTDDQQELFFHKQYEQFKFVHVKSPRYVGNGLKRMMSIWAFAWRMFIHRRKFEKPDIVLHNVHTPFDYPISWMAKRLKARYIVEAWDMWPENFVTFGLISASNPLMKLAYKLEYCLYSKADEVVFTFEGGTDYLKEKGWSTDAGGKIDLSKVHYINNGVNLEKFDNDCLNHQRNDEDLKDPNTYKIIYLGSIRLVNNVKQLIDAAAILKDNPKYRILIYGDGMDRSVLEKYVAENHIDNVVFKEKHIPLCEVAYVVSQATVNIMNYQKNFGIHGVSSGKMFQYFAAGRPICCNIKLNYSEISRRGLGIDRELDTPQQYASAIRELAEQSVEDYQVMCRRVRQTAFIFDYKVLTYKEIDVLRGK